MNIAEIIAQEEKAFNAKNNVEKEVNKNKAEILLPFTMVIFDFLEIIQNDPNFLFTCSTNPDEKDYSPLFSIACTIDFYRQKAAEDINSHASYRMLTRSFSYGNDSTRYISFGITDDFAPYLTFTGDLSPKIEDRIFSTEKAMATLTRFFLERRKPL